MKLPCLRWSLKLMFLGLTIACLLAGLRAIRVNRRAQAIGRLERSDVLLFDSSFDYAGPDAWWRTLSDALSLNRSWPHRFLGDWGCQEVYARIELADVAIDDQLIDDIDTISVDGPRSLTVMGRSVELSSPEKLRSLGKVQFLYLGGKWITREYVDALLRSGSTELLVLLGSSLSEDDFRELGRSQTRLRIVEGSEEDLNDRIEMIKRLADSSAS